MPRIEAASVEEHVRLQTARILDAAAEQFRVRGYRQTDMDDIAAAVGLARNSLYRYYRNKDHILLACVARDMGTWVAEMESLAARLPDPAERIAVWLDLQIEMATGPAHATLELIGELREAPPEVRRELAALHSLPTAVLETAVGQLLRGERRDKSLVAALIAGMVEAGATQALRRGNKAAVKRELRTAVCRLLQ